MDDFLEMLSDELLVSVATFLGIWGLGRLTCVAARFAAKRVASPADEGAAAAVSLAIAGAAAKLAVGARPRYERDRRPRQPDEPWLRVLAALFNEFSRSSRLQ